VSEARTLYFDSSEMTPAVRANLALIGADSPETHDAVIANPTLGKPETREAKLVGAAFLVGMIVGATLALVVTVFV
jgi:hypothetical protein